MPGLAAKAEEAVERGAPEAGRQTTRKELLQQRRLRGVKKAGQPALGHRAHLPPVAQHAGPPQNAPGSAAARGEKRRSRTAARKGVTPRRRRRQPCSGATGRAIIPARSRARSFLCVLNALDRERKYQRVPLESGRGRTQGSGPARVHAEKRTRKRKDWLDSLHSQSFRAPVSTAHTPPGTRTQSPVERALSPCPEAHTHAHARTGPECGRVSVRVFLLTLFCSPREFHIRRRRAHTRLSLPFPPANHQGLFAHQDDTIGWAAGAWRAAARPQVGGKVLVSPRRRRCPLPPPAACPGHPSARRVRGLHRR